MAFPWLRHLWFSVATTSIWLLVSLLLAGSLDLNFPDGLDKALTLACISYAAAISVFMFMPLHLGAAMAEGQGVSRAFLWWLVCSLLIAMAGSLGGGIVRRLIVGEETVLSRPLDIWWNAVAIGWALAFAMCLFGANIYRRFGTVSKAMDELDAWVMGCFASAGALASLAWYPFGTYTGHPLIRIVLAALFAGLTGAGGGLVASLIGLLTFEFAPRAIPKAITGWFLKMYVGLAMGAGLVALAAIKFAAIFFAPERVTYSEFERRSFGVKLMGDAGLTSADFAERTANLLFFTDVGNQLLTSIFIGAATCYVFRIAVPFFLALQPRGDVG